MRTLVVEDDLDLGRTIAVGLADVSIDAVVVRDGREGLDLALDETFDAIILDLMLPGLDGRSFLRHLRRESAIPVLVLTAIPGLQSRVGSLDDGADDYVTKPFEMPELISRLRAIVRRAGGSATDRVQVGDLVIHLGRREVLIKDEPIELRVQEYRILEALVLAQGKPVNRVALWHRIAGYATDETSNAVSVYIHRLRSKLGEDIIETRYGHGYAIAQR